MDGQRIAEIRKMRGVSQEVLADRAGLARPYISMLERGHSKPSVETLSSIARALDVSLSTFFSEEDERGDHLSPRGQRPVPVFDPGKGRSICAALFQSISDGEYPTGHGEMQEATSSRDPNAFYIVARGQSMTGGSGKRDIQEGDFLLVEPNKEVRDGDIVLCRKLAPGESDALVKVFKRLGKGQVALVALNPEFTPVLLDGKALKKASFYRVTEIKRKI